MTCALTLEEAGVDVLVLEASDGVGGRVRTDVVDGFLLDRGFQVLNPGYPMLADRVDMDALGLRPLTAGVGVRSSREEDLLVLADPVREPQLLPQTLRSGKLHPASLAALARWAAPARNTEAILRGDKPDSSRKESMDAAGLLGPLRRIVDAVISGMVLEDTGETSTAFTHLLARSLTMGTPGLPAAGMQALPEQLSARLRTPVQLHTRAESVSAAVPAASERARLRTHDGQEYEADLVVIATDPISAQDLTGVTTRAGRGVSTHWYAAPQAPTDLSLLVIDQRAEHGPVVHTAVVSNVAPTYAPAGQSLIQASTLLPTDGPGASDGEVLRHTGEIYGVDTTQWRLLRRDDVRYAIPVQLPPYQDRYDLHVDEGLIMAGDHRDTASIQGAMVSGHRAAEGFLARRAGHV